MTNPLDQIAELHKTQVDLGWQLTRAFLGGVRELWRVQVDSVSGVAQEAARGVRGFTDSAESLQQQSEHGGNGGTVWPGITAWPYAARDNFARTWDVTRNIFGIAVRTQQGLAQVLEQQLSQLDEGVRHSVNNAAGLAGQMTAEAARQGEEAAHEMEDAGRRNGERPRRGRQSSE